MIAKSTDQSRCLWMDVSTVCNSHPLNQRTHSSTHPLSQHIHSVNTPTHPPICSINSPTHPPNQRTHSSSQSMHPLVHPSIQSTPPLIHPPAQSTHPLIRSINTPTQSTHPLNAPTHTPICPSTQHTQKTYFRPPRGLALLCSLRSSLNPQHLSQFSEPCLYSTTHQHAHAHTHTHTHTHTHPSKRTGSQTLTEFILQIPNIFPSSFRSPQQTPRCRFAPCLCHPPTHPHTHTCTCTRTHTHTHTILHRPPKGPAPQSWLSSSSESAAPSSALSAASWRLWEVWKWMRSRGRRAGW